MVTALLLSGGMDSAAIAYWKNPEFAITINYGQLSALGEIRAAAEICRTIGITHSIITVDCRHLGSGDLSGSPPLEIAPASEWWPFRNQLLLTLAGIQAVSMNVDRILFGSVSSDSFHADGRKEFFDSMQEVFDSQEGGLILSTPALGMTTAELVRQSGIPIQTLRWSHSCHVSDYACGTCRGCYKYLSTMEELGYE